MDATVQAMFIVLGLLAFAAALPFDSLMVFAVGVYAVARVASLTGF